MLLIFMYNLVFWSLISFLARSRVTARSCWCCLHCHFLPARKGDSDSDGVRRESLIRWHLKRDTGKVGEGVGR